METYHRKRSKRSTINANNDIICLKRNETSSMLGGAQCQTPSLARQLLLDTNYEVSDEEEVELGSIYEIYHKNLPPRTPVQLRSTRVVMVSEKTELNVAIRYPSVLSLRTYFGSGITELYPALDEKFVMGIKLASKVLLRQVTSQEFTQKKHLEDFWMVNPNPDQFKVKLAVKNEDIGLMRELKNNMVRWGIRKQVVFIGRHKESSNAQSSSSFVHSFNNNDEDEDEDEEDEKVVEETNGKEENDNDDDEAEEEEDEVEEEKDEKKLTENHKRKLRKRKKQVKQNNQLWQVQVTRKPMKKCRKLARDPSDRWSKERYMAAELSLLEAMQEKNAMIGNPITRPALRIEARKRIGDTGLLDHLLKHVANKVAPGGELRFRRSHNADGAMEYWLENADLLKIRKEAGVSDPFWTPPPGWKLGDSPIQDPIMAKELNHLKEKFSSFEREKKKYDEEMIALRREKKKSDEEIMALKREKKKSDEEMVALIRREKKKSDEEIMALKRGFLSNKVFDEEMTKFRRDMEKLISKSKKDESQVTDVMVSEHVDMMTSFKQVIEFFNSLLPNSDSEPTDNSVVSMEKCKKEMLVFSDFLKRKIKAWVQEEEEVGKERSKMELAISPIEKKNSTCTELITTTKVLVSSSHAQEKAAADQNEDVVKQQQQQQPAAGDNETNGLILQSAESQQQQQAPGAGAGVEGKAAMIQRLKSGFRICRPQGTFLWPNMVMSSSNSSHQLSTITTTTTQQQQQQQLQIEDMLVVPTPPSVNSSTPAPFPPYHHLHHHLSLPSPVKPFPERRPVTLTVSSSSTNNLINLNHIPTVIIPNSSTAKSLLPSGANFPGGFKKRKTSSSSSSSSGGASPSCLSNIGTPTWLVEPPRHQQHL